MTELETIRSDIFSALAASWGTASLIALPNHDFKPSETSSWIRPVIKIAQTNVEELGDNGVGLRDGLLMISVFSPSGGGMKPAIALADRLETFFRRRQINNIWFDEVNSDPQGNDPNGYYHIMVMVPFHSWVGEF